MNFPSDLKYTPTDEWVRVEGNTATVGISDFAQSQLSDIVYVELPSPGAALKQGEAFGTVESVKAASDLNTPADGAVTETNSVLADEPEWVNKEPYGQGWMIKFTLNDPAQLDGLMSAEAYAAYCEGRQH